MGAPHCPDQRPDAQQVGNTRMSVRTLIREASSACISAFERSQSLLIIASTVMKRATGSPAENASPILNLMVGTPPSITVTERQHRSQTDDHCEARALREAAGHGP